MLRPSKLASYVGFMVFGPFFLEASAGTPYYVDNCGHDTACNGTATTCYNGGAGSPNCARKTIQGGIDATQADGDEVVVANGTYKGLTSATSRNRDIRFTKWGNGDPRLITVRSANGAANCIIDCDDDTDGDGEGRAFDFDHVSVGEINKDAIIGTPGSSLGVTNGKGFTIRNGDRGEGGAIIISATSPTIRDCIFEDNDGGVYGGAISILKTTSPLIEGCIFQGNNRAQNGGAISMRHINSEEILGATIKDCTFSGNGATATFLGGAIYIDEASEFVMSGCRIDNNTATNGGGGIYLTGASNAVKIANTRITRNNTSLGSPPVGGGLFFNGPASDTVINPELMNCVIAGNKASSGGGIYSTGRSQMAIANSVFYHNTATDTTNGGHAIWYNDTQSLSPKPNVANSIIWHSSAPTGVLVRGSSSALRIEESNIRETLSGVESSHNINLDPDFVRYNQKLWIAF